LALPKKLGPNAVECILIQQIGYEPVAGFHCVMEDRMSQSAICASSLIAAMIFSPRSDKFPELLHELEPKGALLHAAHERRVEVDFLRTDTPAALNLPPTR